MEFDESNQETGTENSIFLGQRDRDSPLLETLRAVDHSRLADSGDAGRDLHALRLHQRAQGISVQPRACGRRTGVESQPPLSSPSFVLAALSAVADERVYDRPACRFSHDSQGNLVRSIYRDPAQMSQTSRAVYAESQYQAQNAHEDRQTHTAQLPRPHGSA